jgi:hypothetical protein
MVNHLARSLVSVFFALALCEGRTFGAQSWREIPPYRVGDEAKEEITAAVPLTVVNEDETTSLKQKESLRVPVLCRYQTNVAPATEVQFINSFFVVKSNFLARLETVLGTNRLAAEDLASPRFQKFYNNYRRANKGCPITTNLAGIWASGESDELFLGKLSGLLREEMRHGVRAGTLPPEMKLTWSVRMVYVTNLEQEASLEMAEKRGVYFRNTNVLTVGKAREELVNRFPAEEKPLGKFVASFVVSNCAPDLKLTQLARSNRIANIWASDQYAAGEVVVKQGQIIDKKSKAALDQLREKVAMLRLEEEQRNPARPQQAAAAIAPWQIYAAGGGVFAAVVITWIFASRRRQPASLVPALSGRGMIADPAVVPCDSCGSPVAIPLSVRERNAEALRQAMAPNLAQFLKTSFVQRLLSQRNEMTDTQLQAASEMLEMEARLEKIHAPLRDRLRAYEQRIVELENELEKRETENEQLIKTKIQLMRQQMAHAEEPLQFN